MLRLGEKQELVIVKKVNFGVYLADHPEDEERVLLPAKEVPEGSGIGDVLRVLLYKDSKDRMIATLRDPYILLGQTAVLRVSQVSRIGAFLDWGLEKDLLLPFHEQTRKVSQGEECLVALYIDKSGRLAATMNVYPYLKQNPPYSIGDQVQGRIYETSEQFGVFVAVDDQYSALIPKRESAGTYRIGDIISCRVTDIKEDGKMDLSPREKAWIQMDADAELILKVIDSYDGVLPFGEKVSPEIINREFGLSKNAFKRAVGRLLKQGKIELTENRIFRR